MSKEFKVGLRFEGDASSARKAVTDTAKDMVALAETAAKVKMLDSAVASVDRFAAGVQAAQAKAQALRATLSEAHASGADAPMIRNLERDLAKLERQLEKAEVAFQKAQVKVVDLNLRFADAGISSANLAEKKAELVQRSEAVAQAAQEEAEYLRFLANETERAAEAAAQLAADTKFEAQRQAAIEYQRAAEYAGWWADAMERDERALADLDAALDLDKQRQANIQTQKAAEYAEWWATELAQVDRAAQTARASTTTLNNAFARLNIRSAAQIDAEIIGINQALLELAKRADVTGDEFDRAFAAAQKRLRALKQEADGTDGALEGVSKRAGVAAGLLGRLAMAFGGTELARQFVLVNAELENIERSFVAITGSAEAAAAEMNFARDVANRLGVDQIAAAKSYSGLMAAVKGTALEGEKSRQVFESVTRAMALAGKSSADTEGALLALQQMANKGIVQMEELRGQLGERLPGALKATADGLGITTAQLIKLVESGQMTADELLPALADGLNKLYKDASSETLTQEWVHFKAAVEDAFKQIGDAGVVDVLKTALEGMEVTVFGISTGFVALGKNLGVLLAALANGDIGINGFSENAKQAFAEIEDEVRKRTLRIAQHNSLMAAGLDDTGKKMLVAAEQQRQATAQSASDWIRLSVAYTTVKESGSTATKQAQKLVAATKASGQAAIEAAALLGNEAERHRVKAEASAADAAALVVLAERKHEESAMATEHAAAMQAEAEAAGGASAQQQIVIDGLLKTAEARQVDAQEAEAQARRAQYAASAAKSEADALADNSSRLNELKAAHLAYVEVLAAAREQKEKGLITSAEFTEIELAAAQAAALYRDALADQTAALERKSAAAQQAISLESAQVKLAIEQQKSIHELAKARGDELTAYYATVEIRKLEIKLQELVAKAKAAEAKATLELVKARRAELEAAGDLTAAKKAELDAQEKVAEIKGVEAKIAAELARRMKDLNDETGRSGSSARNAAKDHEKLADALGRVADNADRAADAQDTLANRGETRASVTFENDYRNPALPADLRRQLAMNEANEQARAAAANPQTAPAVQSSFTINLSLNNRKSAQVNVASRNDAEQLKGFLRQLEIDASRAY